MNIIIVGGGQIGSYIAALLIKNDHNVKVIEHRQKVVEQYYQLGLPKESLVIGDGTDVVVLEQAGIKTCDALVCVTGLDEVNLTISMIAKFEYNVPKVFGRVNNPKNSWLFNTRMGIDVKINQADIIGHMVADEMNYQSIMTLMRLSKGDYSIVKIHVDYQSQYVGQTISNIPLPKQAVLIGVSNDNELIIPHGKTVIEAGQDILAFASQEAIEQLNRIFLG